MPRLTNIIEAILYLKGKPLSLAQIAEYASSDCDSVADGLIELMNDYAHRESALEILETPDGYILQLRSAYQTLVETLVPVEVGLGTLRTLAVIALKGPLSQTELVNLRGSNAYHHVQELVEQGFVRKRRHPEGRSFRLQVTDKFHQYFQVDRLEQLNRIPTPSLETNTKEQEFSHEYEDH